MILPDYNGGSIVNLAASILQAFDIEPPQPPCHPDRLPAGMLRSGSGVVLVLCDALGALQLEAVLASGGAPNIQRLIEQSPQGLQRLTSVFPSTTSVALTSINTARSPAQHGLLGMWMWLEELGVLGNMLEFRTATSPVAIDPELLRNGPTIYELLQRRQIPSAVVSPHQFADSSFTSLLHRGARYLGYHSQAEIPHLLDLSMQETGRPSFHYVYWPMIDTTAHRHGPLSAAYYAEVEYADLMVGKIAACCAARGYNLVFSADHGQAALRPDRALALNENWLPLLRHPPAGGRRALYLATDHIDQLRRRILERDGILAVPTLEAIAQNWFGGDCTPYQSRLGDLLLLPLHDRQWIHDFGRGAQAYLGAHAGLSEDEMLVPLLAAHPSESRPL
ncbi:MAG: hypothetical protein GKR89_30095 [Candidatus Latescibacteria bacterium]|nr:hypothetical protein [Candidatus Latescibacterota bacterium]